MSYCLGDETSNLNTTSWISFEGQRARHLSFNLLVDRVFYCVNLKGITIEDTFIDTQDCGFDSSYEYYLND